ncbi:MAG: aldo/keto reductase [Eubacterium sp.]|jgi:predicted aldo/keto reductase-like oxidoreductase/ferredoxin|nr:aldo/keto reductase [Eubacterium sp.]MCH4045955.1 aldo/keto reductase [Eubacterium sp.]MCH4079049.1 aldo/keto reductase [Eubacterium sp.]MCH4111206.1 aldo/keto reductase [Eubacterium sp.]MCI1307991.1 aldo/keto reductase [Eubacterium sp.]
MKHKLKKVQLGNAGIEVTPVGMGTLTMGFSQKNLPVEDGAAVIVHAAEMGINFFDTAQYYDTYRYLRPALDEMERRGIPSPVICSKTLAPDYEGTVSAVHECLEKLNLSSIDIFLLHEVRGVTDFLSRQDAWKALQDLKKEGLIHAIGISTHHVDACRKMADEQACDVVFPLINKAGLGIRNEEKPGTRDEMEAAIKVCSDAGKGIFTMKAFGGGNLIRDYRSCLDYVSHIPGNNAVMIGMADFDQVDKAVDYFTGDLHPDYEPDITGKHLMVDQSDCEGCGTCKARCVSQAIFWNENGLAEIDQTKCVHCGYCAPVCPVRAIIFL